MPSLVTRRLVGSLLSCSFFNSVWRVWVAPKARCYHATLAQSTRAVILAARGLAGPRAGKSDLSAEGPHAFPPNHSGKQATSVCLTVTCKPQVAWIEEGLKGRLAKRSKVKDVRRQSQMVFWTWHVADSFDHRVSMTGSNDEGSIIS